MFRTDLGRRDFMRQMGLYGLAGLATVGAAAVIGGCGSKEKAEEVGSAPANAVKAAQEAADPCNDLTTLTDAELTTRATFKYVPRAADATKICRSCNFWQEPVAGEFCGSCTLVKGPIHPLGGCMSWVATLKS
jgi:hypothetical protein